MARHLAMQGLAVRRLRRTVAKINRLQPQMAALSDAELQGLTAQFRQRLAHGASLDSLLVEAFAAIREADRRVLGMFPYDVQVMGAVGLCQGEIIEMKTGEGKTLVATMALYLMGLTQRGAFLVTTNEYLAARDGKAMGRVYRWMGETVAIGFAEHDEDLKVADKQKIYGADIIYTTNAALGFDYLINNLAASREKQYMRPLSFAIVDEADAVLLDAATSPLIIAGAPRANSDLIGVSDEFIYTLQPEDYKHDEEERSVWLTQAGIDHLEHFFQIQHVYAGQQRELLRQVNLALKAHQIFERDKDYVVTPTGKVALLDRANGRVLEGMKLQAGEHQAIEMKEQLELTADNRAVASITYQSLFNKFDHLAGMTGTAKVAEPEFINNYGLKVVPIPTHRPVIRRDLPDQVFLTLPDKLMASLDLVKKLHQKGRPVLLITANVDVSEIYSELLLRAGIAHSVLNAKNAAKEAAIVKEAGQPGAVTVATTMAGRGTDIKLGPGVAAKGGLAVIGTEKMPSKRVDQQLQGRAGRQGDPGSSQFFVSLEDEVMRTYGPEWVKKLVRSRKRAGRTGRQLHGRRFRQALDDVQTVSDESQATQRQHSLAMDLSMQQQRQLVYQARNRLLQGTTDQIDYQQLMRTALRDFCQTAAPLTDQKVGRYILDNLSYQWQGHFTPAQLGQPKTMVAELLKIAQAAITAKQQWLQTPAEWATFYRVATLKAIDDCWVAEVDNLDQLRQLAGDRAVAQRDPMAEYYQMAYRSYQAMRRDIRQRLIRNLALSQIVVDKQGKKDVYFG